MYLIWFLEVLFKELKSGLGLGEHQVTKHIDRIEKSIAISIIAYLVLVRARKGDIKPGQPWSIFQLKNSTVVSSSPFVQAELAGREHGWFRDS